MKKFLYTIFLIINLAFLGFSNTTYAQASNELVLTTHNGTMSLPSLQKLQERATLVKENTSLDEQKKQLQLANISQAIDNLQNIDNLNASFEKLKLELDGATKKTESNKLELEKIVNQEAIDYQKLSQEQIQKQLAQAQAQLAVLQQKMAVVSSERNRIQTLPEKSQSIITNNNLEVKKLLQEIDNNSFENNDAELIAIEIYKLNLETNYYKEQLDNLSVLQELYSSENKLITEQLARTETEIKELNSLVAHSNTNKVSENKYEQFQNISPTLDKYLERFKVIQEYINESKADQIVKNQHIQELENINTKINQIQKNFNSQIKELEKSLILSRLLNKQQDLIPSYKLKMNLDQEIADLNISLYNIRDYLDRVADVDKTVQKTVAENKELIPYESELKEILSIARTDINELYQLIVSELSQTVELKVQYTTYLQNSKKIKDNISEQLFWLKSNQPLTIDSISNYLSYIPYQWNSFLHKVKSDDFKTDTLKTVEYVILPIILLALSMLFFKKKTIKYNNDLAKRLDTDSDSIFITPLAVINNTLMMIPNLSWKILIGSIIICVALANTSRQYEVILIMCLHIFVFSFFLQVLKPNALVQRHFSVAPYKIARYRSILNAVWLNAIPLLMFANVAETDSVHIYEDSSSYFIVLLSCIGLLYIVGRLLVINLKNKSGSSSATILTCCIAAFFALLAIFSIASGYFYTVVKLINRFAFTCYLILAYYLVAEVAHRMIYVFTTKSFKKARNKSVNDCSALHHVITSLGASPEHLTKRAFRLTNFVLISLTAIFMYFQWNDLASVLGYLDNIKLWQKQELINGQMVETEYLSLFMILLALFILVVTAILYKNLPVLLERLLLVGNDSFFKNSSYTVRVLVSYIIIAVGCIAAAGTLGVHWENLQWLVAALSVGLGFGLQEIFANFVSGLILLLERQVRVGDIITLSDMSGTVSKIRIRATTIMNFENKEVMIPNRLFITSSLTNWSLSSTVTKLSFEVGVAYNADVEKAKKLLHRIIARCPYISKDHAALVYVSELAASSVNIICEVYITKISERKLTSDYLSSNTLRVFAQNDIEIPFNQLDVNVKTLEKEEFLEKIRCSLFKQNNEDLMLENKIGTK